jgi:ribosomal protein S18 acetylase RimI-like enzyme
MLVNVRPATAGDGPFLTDMLVHAAGWHAERRLTREAVLAAPELLHYVEGWPRRDDRGVVAELSRHQGDLPTGTPVGAAWLRYLTVDDPGYGYVDDDTPELIIGVEEPFRRQGVGRSLLSALAVDAQAADIEQISLGVERGNGAVALYRDMGFETVSERDGDRVMLLRLGGVSTPFG